VWWRVVSSATLDTTTSFIGNILALTSITLNTGATLDGRALAQTGAVTLDTNTITGAACLTAPPPPPPPPPPAPPPPPPAPPVSGVPDTGGAALRGEDFPWSAVLVTSVVGAMALGLSVREYRRRRTQVGR
jgi:hypothetical protein